jgi:hypothetical protein
MMSRAQPQPQERQTDDPCRETLRLWLRWNDLHERLTEQLFAAGVDPQRVQDELDRVEQLRFAAIRRTRALLEPPTPAAGDGA